MKQSKKLLPIVKITKRSLETSERVYCVTVNPKHRIVVNQILTSQSPNIQQCPKQGSEAKDFRMIFQPPQNIEDWSEMSSESVIVEKDDGEILELLPDVYCFVNRDGKEVKVLARDMREGDDFLEVL